MDKNTLESGYVMTHPHEPYEDLAAIHINHFAAGELPWQAQVYTNGSLVEAQYFPTEADALRWVAREMTLIACAAMKEDGRADMLAALKAGVQALARTLPRSDTDSFHALCDMRAAVAKAEREGVTMTVPAHESLEESLVMLSRLIGTTHPDGLKDMRDIVARVEQDATAMVATLQIAREALLYVSARVLDNPDWQPGEYAQVMQAKEHIERTLASVERRA